MSTEIPLPTGSYVTNDPRGSSKRLVGCFSEGMDTTSSADSKAKVVPILLRRAPGIQSFAAVYQPGPVLISMAANVAAPVLAAVLAGRTIELSWTFPESATGFTLYRSLTGSSFALYQTFSGSTFSYNDTGLAQGQPYYYYIVAQYAGLDSVDSDTVSETIAVPTTPIISSSLSGVQIDLSWTASTVQGSTIANYYLYKKSGSGSFTLFQTLSGSTLSYDDTSVFVGFETYSYYVYAESVDSRISANSATTSTIVEPTLSTFVIEFAPTEFMTNGAYHAGNIFDDPPIGTLVSGGGNGGLNIEILEIAGTSGAVDLYFSVAGSYYPTNPFLNATFVAGLFSTITWTDRGSHNHTMTNGGVASVSGSDGYWYTQMRVGSSGAGSGVDWSPTQYTFTVTP